MARAIWLPGGGGADLDVVTAAAGDVVKGKVIVDAEGNPLTGTLALTGNAGAADIRENKTAYTTDPKAKITGTMAELAAQTLKPGKTAKTLSCANKYMTGNVTVPAISIPASYIKKGQKITFPDGSSITGEFEGWVPVATDLYYMGENPAGFTLNSYAKFENTKITFTRYYGPIKIIFGKDYDVRAHTKLILEGYFKSYDESGTTFALTYTDSNNEQDLIGIQNNGYVNGVTSRTLNITDVSKISKGDYIWLNMISTSLSYITRIRLA